ncbi:MAG: ATP-binding protein [Pseudomonadota bacterium]
MAQLEPPQEWITPYLTNNMAASYGALNNLDSARHYVELGLPLAKKYNDYGLVANCYFILGNLYANAGQYALALEQFTLAQPYRKKTGNVFYQVADLYVMADLYYKLKNYQQGIQTGLAGLQLAEQNNLTLKLEGVYQALAKNYEALEDFRNASKYFQLLANIKDTLYQRATADALADMQLRYETEKKELQLAEQQRQLKQSRQLVIFLSVIVVLSILLILVWRKQVTMKQRESLLKREKDFQAQLIRAVLSSQEEERARTARDLHDGFGQLITSVKLCLNQTAENWKTHATDLLDQMHQEIRNISFALLPHTLVSEGLVPALEELAERISRIGTLQVHVHAVETHRLNPILEVSIYRACQEWITNISKYASASQVHLNIIHDTPTLSVTIEDDGLGFNPQMLNQGNGNGWKNIQSRIQLHEGTVWVDSEPGKRGSTLLMEVPLDVQRKVA